MYGHPQTPDPWAERQEIPPYTDPAADEAPADSDPSGFVVGCSVVAVPVFFVAFAFGYMTGVWGWV